jgi:hypothetical protein
MWPTVAGGNVMSAAIAIPKVRVVADRPVIVAAPAVWMLSVYVDADLPDAVSVLPVETDSTSGNVAEPVAV